MLKRKAGQEIFRGNLDAYTQALPDISKVLITATAAVRIELGIDSGAPIEKARS
jgi:hypothetical protein